MFEQVLKEFTRFKNDAFAKDIIDRLIGLAEQKEAYQTPRLLWHISMRSITRTYYYSVSKEWHHFINTLQKSTLLGGMGNYCRLNIYISY